MRSVAFGILTVALASCATSFVPGDPVFSGYTRTFKYPAERPHEGLVYTSRKAMAAPVLPVMAFGAAFDLDLVLMAKEGGDYDMIEFARVSLPRAPTWIALETLPSGEQTLVANVDGLQTLLPEIPLPRVQQNDLLVTDKSTESTLDITVDYTNTKGNKVHGYMTGDPPIQTAKHRNGQTFNHSQNALMVVLDIPASEPLFKGAIEFDGESWPLRNVGGVVPGRFAMEQAMGGLAIASFKVIPGDAGAGGDSYGKVVYNPPGKAPSARATPESMARITVQQNQGAASQCWTDRLGVKKDLKGGTMAFELTVAEGKVTAAKVVPWTGAGAFTDAEIAKCTVAALNTWTFDPTVSGTAGITGSFDPGDVETEVDPSARLGGVVFTPPAPPAAAATPVVAAAPVLPPEDLLQAGSFTTVHNVADGATIEMPWLVSRSGDRVVATQTTDFRTLEYTYRVVKGQQLELMTITVEQYGRATPVTAITFNPPLPDLRWVFPNTQTSQFVIDVNGQQNHAYGDVEVYWADSGPKVKVTPLAPEWVKARPMVTTISYPGDGTADVRIERATE